MKIVSLFSGIGGFEEGFNLANLDYEIVFASEIDKYARKSYGANFNVQNLRGNIKEIDEYDIPDHDLLLAGFPCQSFSIAGNRRGFDDIRGTLFFDIVRILKAKKPNIFSLENVKNLIGDGGGKTIKTILQNLSSLGYSIDFEILNSKDSGVPQNRERTYIVGVFNYPLGKYKINSQNKRIEKIKRWCNDSGLNTFNFFDSLIQKSDKSLKLSDVILNEIDDKYFFNNPKITNFLKNLIIDDFKTEGEIIKLFDLPKEIHNDQERQRRVYSLKGISPTVLARTDSAKILIQSDNCFKIRKTTPYENFLIQGFSRNFVNNILNCGMSDTQMYKQAGNAVSPPVIRDILNHFNNSIESFNDKQFTFIDLFAGIGGFRLAMESLGGKCVFSSEIDKYAVKTYYENFREIPKGDIQKIDEKTIPNHDILCAGFPCQPFSIGGYRKGFEDTRGTLFFDVARIAKSKQPKIIFLENVAGFINHDGGNTLKVITNILEKLNYNLYYKLMNAKDYGIPQNRNRWYCVGIRKDIDNGKFYFPQKSKLAYFVKDIVTNNTDDIYKISNIAKYNIELHIDNYLKNSRYNDNQILLANEVRKSRCNFRSDGISPCLTAKMGTGGNNVPIIVKDSRRFTERECLTLMGFPSRFTIETNKMQSYKQIGNSVVVPLIRKIGEGIIQVFQ